MKRFFLACTLSALCAVPSHAGSFGFFGTYWDTKDADHGWGGGVRSSFGDAVQFDLRGTYYNDLRRDAGPRDFELHAAPIDAGVSFHFLNAGAVEPYLGGGASYFLLDTNRGDIDDEVGYYGVGGIEVGTSETGPRFFVEAMYRDVRGTLRDDPDDELPDVSDRIRLQLRGISANLGLVWRW